MLSCVSGPTDVPLLNQTIGQALDAAAAKWGGRLALVDRGTRTCLSWSELQVRVDRLALGLLALGLKPRDRVGIWSLNRVEWTLAQFALAKIGLILVTINPAYRAFELEFALRKSGCRALILAGAFKTSDFTAILRTVAPEIEFARDGLISSMRLPELERVIQMGPAQTPGAVAFDAVEDLGRQIDPRLLADVAARFAPEDPINIQFTSGTTGRPKGVTLSHRNILNNGYFTGRGIRLCPDDRVCIPVPLYHCFGLVMGNLACVTHGAAVVYPGEGFDPLATLAAVEQERCTALYGVPTMFIAELDHPRFAEFDLSSLRTGIMAGSPCPVEVMRRVVSQMHMSEVSICYGMTETSPVSFQSAIDDSIEKRVGTVGRIHPHVEAKIVDAAGAVVPRGQTGEFCARGYSVMLGYWDEPEQTAVVKDSEGWMHSGDLATIDAQGYCNIVGRLKDMVIRGGENLYPREIEEFLYRHPAIRDVQLFGVPDVLYGEELCAWIILREGVAVTADEIRDFCRGQIAHQKIPRHVRFVESFPLTISGKPQKYLMRQVMIEELEIEIVATA